jgi:hypothetical protein
VRNKARTALGHPGHGSVMIDCDVDFTCHMASSQLINSSRRCTTISENGWMNTA